MKNNKGITIIALVVTIIVLLILSSISISYVVNKNGIIDNVNSNKENAEIKSIESKLQVESTSFNIQNNGKLNLDKYMSKVEKLDEWKVTENDEEDEIEESVRKNVKEVVVNDKYVFEIKLDNEGIKIEYLGKKGELGPRVIWHTYSNTYDTLTLNVVTRRNKGGTIQYWIKERGSGEYELKSDQLGNTYTFTGLDIDKKYTIQVIAKKDDKQSAPYIIDVDMVKLPELTDENTKFIKTPESWTNENVTVTAQTKMTGYIIQTSQDKENWKNIAYQIVEKNGKVYARLSDGYNSGKVYETDITNIDKLAPNEFTPTATSTTKSITVTASTTDAAAANGSGSSGIAGYRFSKDNGSTWTEYQTSGTYTWNNLPQTTNYTIKVEAKDNAGNVRQGSVSKGTGTVTALTTANTTFDFNPTTWTNGDVTVTVSTTVTGFSVQTSKDAVNWYNTSTQTLTKNNEKVYARLFDGKNSGEYTSRQTTNIDKLAPNTFTPTATSTTKSITVTASTTDAAAANGSGSSGIAGYRFSKDNGSTWTEYQTSGTYTWNNLPQTTNYTIKVEAKDNAGNVRQGSVSKGTGTVTALTTANTTFDFNPTTWTNGDVTVTVSTTVTGFSVQTSKDAVNWYNTSTQTLTKNNEKVYARLFDGKNSGEYTSRQTTNIDKLAPKSTNFKANVTFTELKDASSDIKTEYGFKASLNDPSTGGGSAGYINWYSNMFGLQAGEVFYSNQNSTYYLCIKSLLEKTSSVHFTDTEHFKNIGTSYRVALTVTGTTEDADSTSEYGKSGIDKYLYSKDDGRTWTTKETYKYSDLNVGAYPFRVKAIDKAGNETITGMNYNGGLKGPLTETVTAAQIAANPGNYYGKIVTNYKSSNGWSGWKIFYCNEDSTEGKIFLIADDFVPNSIIPDIGLTKSGTYKATWSDTNKLTGVSDSISNMTLTTFMGTGFNITGKNYLGVKAASKLLNSNNWTKFANSSSAKKAIGGPTIEMWMASWNTLYQSDQLYCNKTNNFGYRVGTTSSPSTDYIDRNVMSAKKGYHNSLYYLSAKSDGARTYWCASPSSYVDTDVVGKRLINIDAIGYVGSDPVYFSVAGIRPVVCLRNDFKIKIIK